MLWSKPVRGWAGKDRNVICVYVWVWLLFYWGKPRVTAVESATYASDPSSERRQLDLRAERSTALQHLGLHSRMRAEGYPPDEQEENLDQAYQQSRDGKPISYTLNVVSSLDEC